jgi:flagellar biosynthesis protein FlhB
VAGHDKTEKATPKKREEARKKGQVARSVELNGAVVLMAALMVLPAVAPMVLEQCAIAARRSLALIDNPGIVSERGIWTLLERIAVPAGMAILPIAFACMAAGVVINVLQVGWKPSMQIVKPDPKKLNPINGFKNLFGPRAGVETLKSLLKVLAVGAIVLQTLMSRLDEFGALLGMPPVALLPEICRQVLSIAQRGAGAYLVIALLDYAYQRYKHDKDLRMDKQEVKDEFKQQSTPQEVRSAMRRRQMQAANRRMMDAVPTADVVVTNPTHYAVALRYDASKLAPEVVAKGMDHVAARIRQAAREAGVPIVPDPPLARSLHAAVEVGHAIPEELFHAVAQVLAFVYRMAARRKSVAQSPIGVA